ncbi:hypothetical protein [Rhizobium leguminosarum]|uniref:hypothetical protein n=1 Tax=Rhizobium leguminosarum TaxID=384 RepID=UPI001C974020|nr:hypothetical protein [Rhizobium leguminosarum]MBY5329565.1 hypothetical protein [Rhizobium leguminosarum]
MNELERKLLAVIAKGHPERMMTVAMNGKMVRTPTAKWNEIQVAMNMTVEQLHDPIAHLVVEGYIDSGREKASGLGRLLGKEGDTLFWATEEGRVISVGPTATTMSEQEKSEALDLAVQVCKQLGYETTQYGVGVCLLSIYSGYTPFEAASQIALGTLARDVREAGTNMLKLMAFLPHARAMIDVIHEYADRGLLRNSLSENDINAMMRVVTVAPEQNAWIDRVLSDPIIAQERMAMSMVDYSKMFGEDEAEA